MRYDDDALCLCALYQQPCKIIYKTLQCRPKNKEQTEIYIMYAWNIYLQNMKDISIINAIYKNFIICKCNLKWNIIVTFLIFLLFPAFHGKPCNPCCRPNEIGRVELREYVMLVWVYPFVSKAYVLTPFYFIEKCK